jgi:hypothetical protein
MIAAEHRSLIGYAIYHVHCIVRIRVNIVHHMGK